MTAQGLSKATTAFIFDVDEIPHWAANRLPMMRSTEIERPEPVRK
jgi:hypothetical protein